MNDINFAHDSFLVVDDDAFSRDVIFSVLAHLGVTKVYEAEKGEDALRLARQHRPDFVLLDIYMPQTDGWTLLGQLRREVPAAAVIMVTGSGMTTDFRKSMDACVDGFCIKPVSCDIMQKTLTQARLRRQGAALTSH